jgi:hypothetical protein
VKHSTTHLEEVNGGTAVQRGLLVDGRKDGRLLRLGRVEGGREVELETLGDLVLELELGAEDVGGGPGLCRCRVVSQGGWEMEGSGGWERTETVGSWHTKEARAREG